jgi:aquaporin Z
VQASEALRRNWPEYLIEAFGLGSIMLVSVTAVTVLEVPLVPALGMLDPLARRALAGLAIAGTVVTLVYSRWGRRSGAHFNPAVTLTFLLLGKVRPRDAVFYTAAQVAGGLAGLQIARLLLGEVITRPPVRWIVTVPGRAGTGGAFAAELLCAFLLMSVVLALGGVPRLAKLTGLAAGSLIFCYILFEAPISGFSLNPARSFASALPSGVWMAFWIYVLAPPLGMLLAALVNRRARLPRMPCAKLIHDDGVRCIHCGFEPRRDRAAHPMLTAG